MSLASPRLSLSFLDIPFDSNDLIRNRVEDTSSRYVAEDNVILLSQAQLAELDAGGGGDDDDATTPEHPTDASGRRIGLADRFPIEIGRFFKRYDAEAGRFVSNVVDEFPED